MELLDQIIKNAPKSYSYFNKFYIEIYKENLDFALFEKLPFDFQLGVFISFFNSVSTDVDLYSLEKIALQDTILESFKTYEEYLFLDS